MKPRLKALRLELLAHLADTQQSDHQTTIRGRNGASWPNPGDIVIRRKQLKVIVSIPNLICV